MKIVTFSSSHALAHVSRQLEVAKVLRSRGHDILMATFGAYLPIAAQEGFRTESVPWIPIEQVVASIRSGKIWNIYQEKQCEQYVEAERALLRAEKPDLVMLDNRPTARIAADAEKLKTAATVNVHMSNFRKIPFFSYNQVFGADSSPPLDLADRFENQIELVFYNRFVMGALNKIRARLGLVKRFCYEHEAGDLTLLADTPQFNPTTALPSNVRFIGPLTWHNSLPPPSCMAQLDRSRPVIYFSLGSSSLQELVSRLSVFSEQGIQCVVATGDKEAAAQVSPPPGVFLEALVNTDLLLPHCNLVCCHGGNGTLYQALAFGLPVVVVATHAEQAYGGKRIVQLGLGEMMTLKTLQKRGIGHLVNRVLAALKNDGFRSNAQAMAVQLKKWNGPSLAADAIEKFAALPPTSADRPS